MAVFSLRPRAPFRLDLTAWTLRRRPGNRMDRWDGETYRRVLPLGAGTIEVAVRQRARALEVAVRGARLTLSRQTAVTAALERLLGLRLDLAPFYRLAAQDQRLERLAGRFRGMRPPRFPSVFEALINGITCQQLSLTVGIIVLNRLAEHCGPALDGRHGFPRPEDLAVLEPTDLRPLGYSHNKARYAIDLARAISLGQLDPETLARLGDQEAAARLLAWRGIGRWTAEYALLRGLGRLDVFPGDDVGARNNLARWLRLRKPLDYRGVHRVLRNWRPYRGLIYFHALLDHLDQAGYLRSADPVTV